MITGEPNQRGGGNANGLTAVLGQIMRLEAECFESEISV